jgi:hypothetical protein
MFNSVFYERERRGGKGRGEERRENRASFASPKLGEFGGKGR